MFEINLKIPSETFAISYVDDTVLVADFPEE